MFRKKMAKARFKEGIKYRFQYGRLEHTFYHIEKDKGEYWMKEGPLFVFPLPKNLTIKENWKYIKQFHPLPKILKRY